MSSSHPDQVFNIFIPDHKKQCTFRLHTHSDLDKVVHMVNDRFLSFGRRRRRRRCGQLRSWMLNELDASPRRGYWCCWRCWRYWRC
jgi:hypothetical protein